MSNPVFEAVRTVMAVRDYQDKPIPSDVVDRIIEAARLTASASNRQPWHFVLVRDRAHLRELGALVRTGPYTARAALAVVVAYAKESPIAISDVSRAIQSMILTAWADGVGSNWTCSAASRVSERPWGCRMTTRSWLSSRSVILRGLSRESRSASH